VSGCGRWRRGCGPERRPGFGPGPVLGQMQHGSALRPGDPGGDRDEVSAHARAAGDGVAVADQGPGGAEQVVHDRRADAPGGVGVEPAGRLMGQRSVDQVGEDGLDDRMLAVGDVGLRGRLGVVGQERVITPDREKFIEFGAVADASLPAGFQSGVVSVRVARPQGGIR